MRFQTKKLLPLLLGVNLFFATSPRVFSEVLEEQTVLAALALNIVRFSSWPPEAHLKESLNLCVVGDSVVQQSFASLDGKQANNKTIQVIHLLRLYTFEQCHVLYLDGDIKETTLAQVLITIKKQPLLTIGSGYEFITQGGMIGLENVGGKITLHVNLAGVREANINISARLLSVAHVIGN